MLHTTNVAQIKYGIIPAYGRELNAAVAAGDEAKAETIRREIEIAKKLAGEEPGRAIKRPPEMRSPRKGGRPKG